MIRHLDELPTKATRLKNPVEISISAFYAAKKHFSGNGWGSAINDKCELYQLEGIGIAEVYNVTTMLPKVFVESRHG